MGRYDGKSDSDIWNDRADRYADRAVRTGSFITRHPIISVLLVIVALAGLSVVSGIIDVGGGYVKETKRVVSVPHVREQTTAVLNDWTSLQQAAINACEAKNSSSSEDDPTLIEDPSFAYRAQYRSIKQDYDRRMSNFFEAAESKRVPLPDGIHGLPRVAPSLNEAIKTAHANGDC